MNYWPSSNDVEADKLGSSRTAGVDTELFVQPLPDSFEGILSEFEAELGVGSWMVTILTGDVYWSEGTYRIHDVAPNTPLGLESALSYYAPEDTERVRRVVEEATRKQRDFSFDAMLVSETGRRKPVRSHGRFTNHDSVPMLTGIIRLRDMQA